jgi:ketosteroid isomerase-like protein
VSVRRTLYCVASLGVLATILGAGCAASKVSETVIGLERGALDRWGKGDPWGAIELCADEVTYFDPDLEQRLNGLESLRALLAPLEGKIRIERYDMIDPRVQVHGPVAVLTYNLVDYVPASDGSVTRSCWNSTEVYQRVNGNWKIIHSHWSRPQGCAGTE